MSSKTIEDVEPSQARDVLQAALAGQKVVSLQPADLNAYLDAHPDLAAVLPVVCGRVRQELGPEAELSLEVYRDPEIDDCYLRLCARLLSYDDETLERLDRVSQSFEEELAHGSGYLLLTTDLRPARAPHAI
jgi:hypothetical protein